MFEIDKDISTKSKFFILKTIQKSLDERVDAEGEEIQKVTWFKETIAKIKSSAGNQDSQPSGLDALKKEIEALKEKQQTEMRVKVKCGCGRTDGRTDGYEGKMRI